MTDDIVSTARRRTRRVAAAGIALAALLLCGTAGLVTVVGRRGNPASQPVALPAATYATVPPAAASSTSDYTWVTVVGARVPVSGDGPHDTRDGLARGFAHTSAGAVLAAAHITLRLSPQVGPAVFEATCHQQVVGPDAAVLLQHVEDDYQTARTQLGATYGAPAGQLYSTTLGYRVQQPSADQALVGLLIQGPGKTGSVLVALSVEMQWTGQDWALVAPTGGTWDNATVIVTDATGYTPFPGGGR